MQGNNDVEIACISALWRIRDRWDNISGIVRVALRKEACFANCNDKMVGSLEVIDERSV